MKQIEIYNFQNLHVHGAVKNISRLPIESKDENKNSVTIVFIREPYAYFDSLLFEYLKSKKSILFTQDIINHMKTMKSDDFLTWLDTINFIPFYNPQTFQMDASKRSDISINNLEKFDYVVPFEEIDIFLENVSLDLKIDKIEERILKFSLTLEKENMLCEKFIAKDIKLYNQAQNLWDLIKMNDFKPLSEFRKNEKPSKENQDKLLYRGTVDTIEGNSISGWVFHKKHSKAVSVEIYNNGKFLKKVKTMIFRPDIYNLNWHPTGYCGFKVTFEEPTFKRGDTVEVKVLPENENVLLGKNAKKFLSL